MGQIPRSTERISSLRIQHCHVELCLCVSVWLMIAVIVAAICLFVVIVVIGNLDNLNTPERSAQAAVSFAFVVCNV